jgi:hypothetical protein
MLRAEAVIFLGVIIPWKCQNLVRALDGLFKAKARRGATLFGPIVADKNRLQRSQKGRLNGEVDAIETASGFLSIMQSVRSLNITDAHRRIVRSAATGFELHRSSARLRTFAAWVD